MFCPLYSVAIGIVIDSNDNAISNNFITEPRGSGVAFGNDRNIIKGNTIVNAGAEGISLDRGGTSDGDNEILNNNIFSSGRDGIFIIGDRTIVKGNSVNGANGFGINIGNFGGIGIRIGNVAVNTIVDGNTVTGNESIGIEVIGSPLQGSTVVTQNIVVGNAGEVVGVGAGQIVNGRTDTIIADNTIATQIV